MEIASADKRAPMPYEMAGEKPWEAISFPAFKLVFFRDRHT